jgi:hypothetical protein
MQNRFERGKGVFSCEVCARKTRGSTGSNVHMCSECYDVSGMENECQDGCATWADAKRRALPLLTDCVRKGGDEDRLRSAFAWAYAAPTAAKSIPPKPAAKSAAAKPAPAEAPKRGRGRPRLGGDVATRTVGVRMSQADADALAAIAEAENTTVAELLRPAVAALLARGKPRV